MAWRTLIVGDLDAKLSPAELKVIEGSDSASTHVASAISTMVDMVRGYVASSPHNYEMGTVGTIPERLMEPTLCALVPKLYSRSAGLLIDMNDVRKDEASEAIKLFRDVAGGRFRVEVATETSDEDSSSSVSVVQAGTGSDLTFDNLKGL